MIRVLLVDDHESMCQSLQNALEETGEFTVVGTLESASMAEAVCARLHPELVFLDVCTRGGSSGLAAAEKLRLQYPEMGIVVMSGFDEVTYAPRAKEAGADGFLYKARSLEDFVDCARRVYAGESFFPEMKRIPVLQGETPLTDREMEILRLRCRPMTNAEIGEALDISPRTVKFHLDNIKAKTGFSDMMELLLWVAGNGWVNPNY